ncbi:MAG: VUT family protein [Hyphomonadaceae bacterium]|nr:VUT family protein [Hyphomonadaceae bacterium]
MNFEKFLALIQQPAVYLPVIGVTLLALFLAKKPATAIYVGLMPLINWSFAAVPTFAIPEALGGGQLQPLAVVTGLVLVVRDFAQREIGHRVLAAMLIGLLFSTMTSWIVVVFASGAAFLISELVDWAVYTFTKRPLSQRIMLSSALSAPLDQVVFIWLASFVVPGIFAWGTILTGIVSKLAGAAVVAWIVAQREKKDAIAAPAAAG